MKKIAVTGASYKDRLIISNALSYLTNFEVVRCTPYAGFELKYNLNKKIQECNWQELFTYTLSSFTERIEIEAQYDKFISNGSVMNELAYIEARERSTSFRKTSKHYSFMHQSLKTIISEYAIKKYDCIIHITHAPKEDNEIFPHIDECLKNLIGNCELKYFIHKENAISEILEKLSKDMSLDMKISPSSAIKKAKQNLINSHNQ